VALNCVGNGRILREGPFENIWIQPASGDAGGALGAALFAWHQYFEKPRVANDRTDSMRGSFLGPVFSDAEIEAFLSKHQIPFARLTDEEIPEKIASLIAQEKVIGWFQGAMEFGPRALGGRSILGDSRSPKMQEQMNLKIKFRESFRPFAPSIIAEKVSEYFEMTAESPYMLLVAPVQKKWRREMTEEEKKLEGIELLNVKRSEIPAVTHVDYSARVQTMTEAHNPRFYRLLKKFDEKYGCPVMINTSFNVRGEPIVCTPEDAFRCFMRTHMDYLILGNYLLAKEAQKPLEKDSEWMKEFELD
jgi:carbamoyltransferase